LTDPPRGRSVRHNTPAAVAAAFVANIVTRRWLRSVLSSHFPVVWFFCKVNFRNFLMVLSPARLGRGNWGAL
jgi:hypothetical protein